MNQTTLGSRLHEVETRLQLKKELSLVDNKRYWIDGPCSLPFGHYKAEEENSITKDEREEFLKKHCGVDFLKMRQGEQQCSMYKPPNNILSPGEEFQRAFVNRSSTDIVSELRKHKKASEKKRKQDDVPILQIHTQKQRRISGYFSPPSSSS